MPTKVIPGAVAADVAIGLALDPPVRGCHGGLGVHVLIPADWFVRCNAGEAIDGCNYSHLESDGSLYVDDIAQSRTADPVYTKDLKAADLQAFTLKLATAVVVVGASVDAQAEKHP